jgi:hypothetical protein
VISNYVMLQGLGGMPMGVLRLVGLIIVRIKLKYLNKTTRDKEAILASGSGESHTCGSPVWGSVGKISRARV